VSTFFEVLDRIRPHLSTVDSSDADETQTPVPVLPAPVTGPERALVLDAKARDGRPDHTVITVPLRESALDAEDYLTRIRGRLVGAEEANRNNQFWSTGDLVFGVGSVAGGPLNWLHEERHIVGALVEATLKHGPQAAASGTASGIGAGGGQPHIEAESTMWSWIYPNETRVVREAAAAGDLYYSMECISKQVECYGPGGCGRVMAYADTVQRNEAACEHIRDRSSVRRLINPVFQGAALIVPPVRPGWANANADIIRRAAASERLQEFTEGQTEIAAQIFSFILDG
jgi:hypothetical protein